MVNYNIEMQGLNLHRMLSFSETSIKACVSPLKRKEKSNTVSFCLATPPRQEMISHGCSFFLLNLEVLKLSPVS